MMRWISEWFKLAGWQERDARICRVKLLMAAMVSLGFEVRRLDSCVAYTHERGVLKRFLGQDFNFMNDDNSTQVYSIVQDGG